MDDRGSQHSGRTRDLKPVRWGVGVALVVMLAVAPVYADHAGPTQTGGIANGAVTAAKLRNSPGAVTAAKIRDGHVRQKHIADGHVQNNHIADGNVQNNHIADGNVQNNHLANGAVNAPKLAGIVTRVQTAVVANGADSSLTVICEPGERILSGGAGFTNPVGTLLRQSERSSTAIPPFFITFFTNGWTGNGRNISGANRTFRVTANCLT